MKRLMGKTQTKSGLLIALTAIAALFARDPAHVAAQFSNKVTTTPIYIQDGFGPAGNSLPYDGLNYCMPTSESMLLSYLGINGFNQIGPSNPTAADGLNMVRVMAGLMDTDPINGTAALSNHVSAIEVYLAAKGIGTLSYSLTTVNSPTLSELATLNQNQTVVQLICGYYSLSSGSRTGGHGVALLSQGVNTSGQPSANTLVINDPAPRTFAPQADTPTNALQYLNTISTTGALASHGALELDPNQYPGYNSTIRDVIETALALMVNPSQLSANNPTPATWNLSSTQTIDLQNGYLSVLAPMAGTGGIMKGDGGTLELEAPNNTSGANTIVSGTLQSDVASGLPFGTGSIQLQSATLQLMPASGTANVSLTAASGPGNQLSFSNGATLALSRNGNSSLALLIGGNSDGTTANLLRSPGSAGTLVIAPADGTAALGGSVQVMVAGSGGNLPAVSNGIVASYIVAEDSDGNGSGDFLTYGVRGFSKAGYTEGNTTPIVSAGTNAVFDANVAQSVPGNTTVQVYALKVGPVAVSGSNASTLRIGPQGNGQAGLILNGGTISTSYLNFGSAEGLIYASQAGGTISATIQGSGGLTTFGPGPLTLTAANGCTSPVNVNSGTLVAASASGSATGSGAVTVQRNATLQVNGVAGGAGGTTLVNGSTLLLSGGTLAGSLTMNSGSYLLGQGTISGPTTIYGTIGSSTTDPATAPFTGVEDITFTNANTSLVSMTYSWRINALDDAPADAGTNWSLLDFLTSGATLGLPASKTNLTVDFGPGVADPNSGNAFWSQPHQWLVAEAPNRFSSIWVSVNFPAFSQGSFSLAPSSGFYGMSIDYTPSLINGQWATNGSGTWSGTANWSGGNVPGALQNTALFGTAVTGGTATVTLDASRSLSSLSFSTTGGAGYVISPSGTSTLNLSNTAGLATITDSGGNDTIAVPILLGSKLSVSATTGSTLTIAAAISASGSNCSLSFSGNGELILSGSNSYNGGTLVTEAMLDVANPNAIPDGTSLTVGSGGTLILDTSSAAAPYVEPTFTSRGEVVTMVPEPGTLDLLSVAGIVAAAVLWQKRRKTGNTFPALIHVTGAYDRSAK